MKSEESIGNAVVENIVDVINAEADVFKSAGAVKVNTEAAEMKLSEIEDGLVATENIISQNNYSSGAAGTTEGYVFKLYRAHIKASWDGDGMKDERGTRRPRKGFESAVKAFFTKAKELTGLGETAVKMRMALYAYPVDSRSVILS